jgi:hypothetical protein
VYALCYTDDGTFHRRFGGVGEKLHEVIDRAPQQLTPVARVDWARGQYRKIYREKAKKYKSTGILFPFPTSIRYDTEMAFDAPFQSPLGDPLFTVPSFTHDLEAPLASTIVLTTAAAPAAALSEQLSVQVGAPRNQGAGTAGAPQGTAASGPALYLRCAHCGFDNAEDQEFCSECGMLLRGTATAVAAGALAGAGGQPDTVPLAPGTLLSNDRYRIIGQVGKGGFGAVYKVADTALGGRALAVKEMINQSNAQEATDAFKREALMLAALQYPALPRIYEHFTQAGRWYLVMDFIEGRTLEEYQAGQALPLEEVIGYGVQLCAVLDFLHTPLPDKPPIIFRDLKPGNIMRKPDGQLVLVDFGIARHFKPGQQTDTTPLGSQGYAAPEQYGKAQTRPQADIYALGATLHCLLTGRDPSETPFFFAPLRAVNQDLPEDLEVLVAQMVDMVVSKRPKTASFVSQELERIARAHLAAA